MNITIERSDRKRTNDYGALPPNSRGWPQQLQQQLHQQLQQQPQKQHQQQQQHHQHHHHHHHQQHQHHQQQQQQQQQHLQLQLQQQQQQQQQQHHHLHHHHQQQQQQPQPLQQHQQQHQHHHQQQQPHRGDDILKKTSISGGKLDVYYYSPPGGKTDSNKSKIMRQFSDVVDLSTIDFQTGRTYNNNQNILQSSTTTITTTPTNTNSSGTHNNNTTIFSRSTLKRQLSDSISTTSQTTISSSLSAPIKHPFDYSRSMRTDASLVPPIRQTASIFKQPVTVYHLHDGEFKRKSSIKPSEVKDHLASEKSYKDKPKQLFWEKRLEGLRACDIDGSVYGTVELPKGLKPVGPNIDSGTLLQSIATALHNTSQAVTGQTASKTSLAINTGVYLNPEQPLMHSVNVTEEDIKRQEERVTSARRKLQDAIGKHCL